ncbi:YciI family protein [Mucilaginibacter sp. McL0603]|uniref:YciI family protein n=1 Tax=Mucilaginibacter sp. McL0603 TaxID=3415670 RepID=UPI003CF054BC
MTDNINHYNGPHYVQLTLEKNRKVKHACSSSIDLSHLQYYQRLQKKGKVICYGAAMNQPAACIILFVSSADDFEQIILNDPALKSGAFKIQSVMPFINNRAVSIPVKALHEMSEL